MLYSNGPATRGNVRQPASFSVSADDGIYLPLVGRNGDAGASVDSAASAAFAVSGVFAAASSTPNSTSISTASSAVVTTEISSTPTLRITHAQHRERLVPMDIFPFRSAVRHSILDRHSSFVLCASAVFTLTTTLAAFTAASNAAAIAFGLPDDTRPDRPDNAGYLNALVGLSSIFGGVLVGAGVSILVGRFCLGGRLGRVPAWAVESDAIEAHVRAAANLEENVERWAGDAPSEGWQDVIAHARLWQGEDHAQTFSAFLGTLHAGAQSSLRGASEMHWQSLRERIRLLLTDLASQPALRHRLFQHAEDALGNCHDRPPITLIDMELIARIEAARTRIMANGQGSAVSSLFMENNLREVVHGCRLLWRKTEFVKLLSESLYHLRDASHDPLEAVISCMAMVQAANDGFIPRLAYPPLYGSLVEPEVLRRHAFAAMTSVLEKEQANEGQELVDFVLQSDLSKDALAIMFPQEVAACRQARQEIEDRAADTDDPALLNEFSRERMRIGRDLLGGYVRASLREA
jgi:hypothetical protein